MKRKTINVKASQLLHDSRYQRVLIPSHVRRLAMVWEDDKAGVIHVSERVDETLWVIDGQHRVMAQAERGEPDTIMLAVCYTGLTLEEEAVLFEALNFDRDLTALDIFHSQVTQKNKRALGIRRIIQGAGLRVSRAARGSQQPRSVSAIRSVETVYDFDAHGGFLQETLDVMKAAWGDGSSVFRGLVLEGVGNALSKHPEWDRDRITDKLAGIPGGPIRLESNARELAELNGITVRRAMEFTIERIYTGRRRSRAA